MSGPPERIQEARQWFEKAEHDLKTAEHTLTLADPECPFDTICFHAQQCAEKYLKGLLVSLSDPFPRAHDLRLLLQMASARLPLKLDVAAVARLNRYTVEGRYPGDWDPITREETERAVAVAKKVREAVLEYFSDWP